MMVTFTKNKMQSILGLRLYRFLSHLFRKISNHAIRQKYEIVFYCQQPGHWQNIANIVSALLIKNPQVKVLLIAGYKNDGYLDNQYPKNLKVIFNLPAHVLGLLKTKIVYTPVTGLSHECRPRGALLVHTLVSLTSLDGVYSAEMFDEYDYILCAGNYHFDDFKRWAVTNPKMQGKILVPAGYPKFDLMLSKAHSLSAQLKKSRVVIYAPTHVYPVNEKLASLRNYGEDIIEALLGADFEVIFRPHPVSFNDEDSLLVARIAKKYSINPSFHLDRSQSYFESYSKANMMVSDLSGTGFTFSVTFLRPTIFFVPNKDAELGLKGIQFDDRGKIGGVARSISELINTVESFCIKDISDDILNYRNETIYNPGSSAEYIVQALPTIIAGSKMPGWVAL